MAPIEARDRRGIGLLVLAVLASGSSSSDPLFAQRLLINEIMSNNQACCADRYGDFDDWIEIYNADGHAVDIGGMFITDDLTDPSVFQFRTDAPKVTTIPPGGFILLWADGDPDQGILHLGFNLASTGEQLGLFASDGETLIDSVTFGPLRGDVSYGRLPDEGDWFLLDEPSPKDANDSPGKLHYSEVPIFSHRGGHYDHPIIVSLIHLNPDTRIFFSTDGGIPTSGTGYNSMGISIENTTVLRARAVTRGFLPSDVITHTYFVDDEVDLPIVSVAVDPEHLWSRDLGIYVKGNRNNFMLDWERPAHLEFYDDGGDLGFSQDVGVKIHGGWSRNQPQKSLAIHARRRYGKEEIDYPLFPDKPMHRYTSFILRNSGNDWTYTLLRDAIMQALVNDRMDIDYQSYRSVVLYLNGQYWGIHNMRERISIGYLGDNYGLDEDEIDYLINNSEVRTGDATHYESLLEYLESNDLTKTGVYEQVSAQMDVDEYLNYQIAEMFIANTDWPGNNLEFWRPRSSNGRWRWILFDTDYGFNLPLALNPSPPEHDMVAMATAPDGQDWPNPPWSTLILRSLLEIDDVRHDFIQRFASHLNTTFRTDRVEGVIDSIRSGIVAEIPRHAERWSPFPSPFYGKSFATIEEWDANLDLMREFARARPSYVWNHLRGQFSLGDRSTLSLEVEPEGAGTIYVNTVAVEAPRWSGFYFNGIPIRVVAVPAQGFEFVSWSEPISDGARANVIIDENYDLIARFASVEQLPVVINEINYNSSETFDPGDWIELHNFGSEAVGIGGWRFRDAGNSPDFILPAGVFLAADGFVVLCRDSTDFRTVFPETGGCLGNLTFGLSSRGEHLTLLDELERIVDSLTYDDQAPWPTEANGTGSTLALENPTLDNSNHEHWYASANGGTPAAPNAPGRRRESADVADFAATSGVGFILLTWRTKFEIGNSGFNIYRALGLDSEYSLRASFRAGDPMLAGRRTSTDDIHYVWYDHDVDAGVEYFYYLGTVNEFDEEARHVDDVQSASSTEGRRDFDKIEEVATYPNPFAASTTVSLSLFEEAKVSGGSRPHNLGHVGENSSTTQTCARRPTGV